MLSPITNMVHSFSDESLLHTPVLVMMGNSLTYTLHMIVTVRSLSYTPHASYSWGSVLHAPC